MSEQPPARKIFGVTVDTSVSLVDIGALAVALFAVYSVWFEQKNVIVNNTQAIVREELARIENDQWLVQKIKKVETDLKGDIEALSIQAKENHLVILDRLKTNDEMKEQRRRDAHNERQKIMALIMGLQGK